MMTAEQRTRWGTVETRPGLAMMIRRLLQVEMKKGSKQIPKADRYEQVLFFSLTLVLVGNFTDATLLLCWSLWEVCISAFFLNLDEGKSLTVRRWSRGGCRCLWWFEDRRWSRGGRHCFWIELLVFRMLNIYLLLITYYLMPWWI